MSGDSALVERMSNAVRAAFKAMEVLKDENRALKDENENLRKQLRALQSGVVSEPRADPVSIPIITQEPVVSPQRSLEPIFPRLVMIE
jgi:cell division septum initiation protein DivIVA